jgi:hypothetical protein
MNSISNEETQLQRVGIGPHRLHGDMSEAQQ